MPRCHLPRSLGSQALREEVCRVADGKTRTRLLAATEIRLRRVAQRVWVCPVGQGADVARHADGPEDWLTLRYTRVLFDGDSVMVSKEMPVGVPFANTYRCYVSRTLSDSPLKTRY